MNTTTINKSIFLAAPREIVWTYLTDRDKLGQWFHAAQSNLIEGQPYTLLENAEDRDSKICWGEVLTAEKPALLRYTFTVKPMGGAMTTVCWTLEQIPGGTRITLTHEGIYESGGDSWLELLMALDKGWEEHLSNLRGQTTA